MDYGAVLPPSLMVFFMLPAAHRPIDNCEIFEMIALHLLCTE